MGDFNESLDRFIEVLNIARNLLLSLNNNQFENITLILSRSKEVVLFLTEFKHEFRNNLTEFILNGIDELISELCQSMRTVEPSGENELTNHFQCQKSYSGMPGRPLYQISTDQVSGLRSLGFTWKSIAEMLSISERTLRNRRSTDERYGEKYSIITDENLDIQIRLLLQSHPNMGEKMLKGALLSKSIHVQRSRLRSAITRVDPIGKIVRRFRTLKRRVYKVECPNALW